MGKDTIILLLEFAMIVWCGITLFFGNQEGMEFLKGFIIPIILTAPITLSLSGILVYRNYSHKNGGKS